MFVSPTLPLVLLIGSLTLYDEVECKNKKGISPIGERIELTEEGMRIAKWWLGEGTANFRGISGGPDYIMEFPKHRGVITKWGPLKVTLGTVEISNALNHVPDIPNEDQGKMIKILYHNFELGGELHVTKETPKPGKHWEERQGSLRVHAMPGQVLAVTLSFVMERPGKVLDHVHWPNLNGSAECEVNVSMVGGYSDRRKGKEDPAYKETVRNILNQGACRAIAAPVKMAMEACRETGSTDKAKYALYKFIVNSIPETKGWNYGNTRK